MGLRERLDDAALLWQSGRHEGAMLHALLAVAATARRKYPDDTDRGAFERVLCDARGWTLNVEYRGDQVPIETVLYKWVRCELVHTGDLPIDLEIISGDDPDALMVRAGGAPEYVLKLSHGWFHHLLDVVRRDPINADVFG